MSDLAMAPDVAIDLCRAAHGRLLTTAREVTDEQSRSPSRLPGWTIGHVLTHLARNADGHSLRLEGALRGEDVARYPGGDAQRDREIDEGMRRPVLEIVADLDASQQRLESVWQQSVDAVWPHPELRGDDRWSTSESPVRRLREVEVHHVDLGLGYEPSEWPDEYVAWELPIILATVPERLHRPEQRQALVAWLAGRASATPHLELDPW